MKVCGKVHSLFYHFLQLIQSITHSLPHDVGFRWEWNKTTPFFLNLDLQSLSDALIGRSVGGGMQPTVTKQWHFSSRSLQRDISRHDNEDITWASWMEATAPSLTCLSLRYFLSVSHEVLVPFTQMSAPCGNILFFNITCRVCSGLTFTRVQSAFVQYSVFIHATSKVSHSGCAEIGGNMQEKCVFFPDFSWGCSTGAGNFQWRTKAEL